MNNVKEIKNTYLPGTIVKLKKMNDKQAPPIGTKGTVISVDDIGTVHINWENGSTLGACLDEDKIEIISYLRTEGNFIYGLFEDVLKEITNRVCCTRLDEKGHVEFNYAVSEVLPINEPLEDIKRNATGWYGVQTIETGFDSSNLCMISDYYGGSAFSAGELFGEMDEKDVLSVFKQMMQYSTDCNCEKLTNQDYVLVEFKL